MRADDESIQSLSDEDDIYIERNVPALPVTRRAPSNRPFTQVVEFDPASDESKSLLVNIPHTGIPTLSQPVAFTPSYAVILNVDKLIEVLTETRRARVHRISSISLVSSGVSVEDYWGTIIREVADKCCRLVRERYVRVGQREIMISNIKGKAFVKGDNGRETSNVSLGEHDDWFTPRILHLVDPRESKLDASRLGLYYCSAFLVIKAIQLKTPDGNVPLCMSYDMILGLLLRKLATDKKYHDKIDSKSHVIFTTPDHMKHDEQSAYMYLLRAALGKNVERVIPIYETDAASYAVTCQINRSGYILTIDTGGSTSGIGIKLYDPRTGECVSVGKLLLPKGINAVLYRILRYGTVLKFSAESINPETILPQLFKGIVEALNISSGDFAYQVEEFFDKPEQLVNSDLWIEHEVFIADQWVTMKLHLGIVWQAFREHFATIFNLIDFNNLLPSDEKRVTVVFLGAVAASASWFPAFGRKLVSDHLGDDRRFRVIDQNTGSNVPSVKQATCSGMYRLVHSLIQEGKCKISGMDVEKPLDTDIINTSRNIVIRPKKGGYGFIVTVVSNFQKNSRNYDTDFKDQECHGFPTLNGKDHDWVVERSTGDDLVGPYIFERVDDGAMGMREESHAFVVAHKFGESGISSATFDWDSVVINDEERISLTGRNLITVDGNSEHNVRLMQLVNKMVSSTPSVSDAVVREIDGALSAFNTAVDTKEWRYENDGSLVWIDSLVKCLSAVVCHQDLDFSPWFEKRVPVDYDGPEYMGPPLNFDPENYYVNDALEQAYVVAACGDGLPEDKRRINWETSEEVDENIALA